MRNSKCLSLFLGLILAVSACVVMAEDILIADFESEDYGDWKAEGEAPKPYTSGTWGPSASVALIERDGRTWHEEAF